MGKLEFLSALFFHGSIRETYLGSGQAASLLGGILGFACDFLDFVSLNGWNGKWERGRIPGCCDGRLY